MPFRWGVPAEQLTGVDAVFKADVENALAPSPYSWVAYRVIPPSGQQAELNADWKAGKGPLAAPPGESAHEFGLGADVYHEMVNDETGRREQSWDYKHDPAWPDLWARVRAAPDLHGGIDFPDPPGPDEDHIEAYRWAHTTSAGTSFVAKLKARGLWGVDPGVPPAVNV